MQKLRISSILILLSFSLCYNSLKSIYVIRYGNNLFPSEKVSTRIKSKFTNLSWLIYYLEDIQGHKILIDTGIENPLHANIYGISNLQEPSSILKSNQIYPNEITDIFLTHGHLDHVGGISKYPNANIFIQKMEYNWIINNPHFKPFHPAFQKAKEEKRLHLVEQEKLVHEIFLLKWTGGHTIGSLVIFVDSSNSKFIFTGDECYFVDDCKKKIFIPNSVVYSKDKNHNFVNSLNENWILLTNHDPSISNPTNPNFFRIY